ncbi:MAG: hypothetical protein FWJ85_02580 [Solitalea sp.]
MIALNVMLIAFMDSFVLWNDALPGKLFTYGLKLLNLIALVYLLSENKPIKYAWAFAVLPLVWIVWEEESAVASFQYLFSSVLPVVSFVLLPDEEQIFAVRSYLKLILYLFIPGIVIYVLLNLVPLPHLTYTRSLDGRAYENYFFLNYSLSHIHFRFFSVFDEPGVVGSLAAMVVFYYRRFLSQWEYLIYIIAGLLSFSLFFMIMFVPLYYFSDLRFLPTIKQKWIKVVIAGIALIVCYFGFIFLLNQIKEDPVLKYAVYNRFEWKNGFVVGAVDNRTASIDGFTEAYDQTRISDPAFWTGHGKDAVREEMGASGLSYKILVYEKGVLIAAYVLLLFLIMHPWNKQFIFSVVSLLFLLALFYQRPLFFKIDYFMLLFAGLKLATSAPWIKEK